MFLLFFPSDIQMAFDNCYTKKVICLIIIIVFRPLISQRKFEDIGFSLVKIFFPWKEEKEEKKKQEKTSCRGSAD